MISDEKRNFTDSLAKVISVIFHPLFMPVYGLSIILSAPTLYGYLPFDIKKLILLIVLLNNVFLPGSLLPFFVYRKIIASWNMSERKERVIPLILTSVLYGTTSFIIFKFPIPYFLKSFIYAIFLLALIVTAINFRWKISLHSAGAGALLAIVLILSLKMYTPLVWYQISVIIISGLVLASRLQLNLHNPRQVWFGFLTGFLGLTLSMILLQ